MDHPSFPMPTPQQLAKTALVVTHWAHTTPHYHFLDSRIISSPVPAIQLLEDCGASEISIEQPGYLPHRINTLNHPYSWPRFMLSVCRTWWSDGFPFVWFQAHVTVPAGADESYFACEPNHKKRSRDSKDEPTEPLAPWRNSPRAKESWEDLQFTTDDLDMREIKHNGAVTTEEEKDVIMDEQGERGSGYTTISEGGSVYTTASEECNHNDQGHKIDEDYDVVNRSSEFWF